MVDMVIKQTMKLNVDNVEVIHMGRTVLTSLSGGF